MTKQKVSIEVISGRNKASYDEMYVVITELYKLEQPMKYSVPHGYDKKQVDMWFIGIREIWEKNLVFKDLLKDTDKFIATKDGECYGYVDGTYYREVSELLKEFMGRSVVVDDFSDLIGKSERIV